MQNFAGFKIDAAQSAPARNNRLKAFAKTNDDAKNFFSSIYSKAIATAGAWPNLTRIVQGTNKPNAIPPQRRLEGSNFNFSSGAPSTLIATQQQPIPGNSGLFTRMMGR